MRCTNCGWENPEDATRCEKCNSPLAIRQTAFEPENNVKDSDLTSTVREDQIVVPKDIDKDSCPNCGFPIREGAHHCPNCGLEFDSPKKNPGAVPFVAPVNGTPSNYDATANPWSNPVGRKTFNLQPISWDDEPSALPSMSYAGERVELRRENTDPSNNTITTKIQAEITSEDGKWFIEDKSDQQSTFIHVGRKMELNDGDVIVLGNRKFIFKA